jgi:hypothetical protein
LIEAQMARRMAIRGGMLAPFVIGALGIAGGWLWAFSAAVGLALTIGNLWLSARLIGGVAENSPHLLMPVGLATFTLSLLLLTGVAIGLKAADAIYFPVTGFVLIGSHLLLVLVEAAGAHNKAAQKLTPLKGNVSGRA